MKKTLLAAAAVAALAGAAQAGPWQPFQFGDVGSVSGPFTITLTAAEPVLDVVDAFLSGDQFRVRVSGVGDFDTSVPTVIGDSNPDYDACFTDPAGRWSKGSINLGAGTWSFDILVTASPFGAGGAAFRSGVPAPASVGLLALAGLTAARRRR
ncbi:MAG: PEP-CTERM sorting domain-containing protein [Phycisphaerales bacterium]|nr:PEP-CTERM sorting domain-containing protein [Phycisphaerales bacterium]